MESDVCADLIVRRVDVKSSAGSRVCGFVQYILLMCVTSLRTTELAQLQQGVKLMTQVC